MCSRHYVFRVQWDGGERRRWLGYTMPFLWPILNGSPGLLPVTSTAAQGEAIVPTLRNWNSWGSLAASAVHGAAHSGQRLACASLILTTLLRTSPFLSRVTEVQSNNSQALSTIPATPSLYYQPHFTDKKPEAQRG